MARKLENWVELPKPNYAADFFPLPEAAAADNRLYLFAEEPPKLNRKDPEGNGWVNAIDEAFGFKV
jgi:hypothetical protein